MMNSLTSLRLLAVTGATVVAFSATPVLAADTGELGVSAEVTEVCNITTSPVGFGNVDVTTAGAIAEGGFSVVCTSGALWTATADAGNGTGASTEDRKMMDGANLLNYALYTDSERATNFVSVTGTGTGVAQLNPIYGRIPTGQTTVPAGSYADSVTINVTL